MHNAAILIDLETRGIKEIRVFRWKKDSRLWKLATRVLVISLSLSRITFAAPICRDHGSIQERLKLSLDSTLREMTSLNASLPDKVFPSETIRAISTGAYSRISGKSTTGAEQGIPESEM
jgi:hypothetical protein